MKNLLAILSLFTCQVANASDIFVYSFRGDFRDAKVYPMRFLLESIHKNPHARKFVVSFYADEHPTYKTKINFDKRKKIMYALYENTAGGKSLTLYRNVTLEKISKCYHSTRLYQSSSDNFEMIEDYGCPSTVLYFKAGPLNGPDK